MKFTYTDRHYFVYEPVNLIRKELELDLHPLVVGYEFGGLVFWSTSCRDGHGWPNG
jgi:hypothetical protein